MNLGKGKRMLSNLCKPYIEVQTVRGDAICVMSPLTWNQFAYFRNIVRDADTDECIELAFTDDFSPSFWKFIQPTKAQGEPLGKDASPDEWVDLALEVKQTCLVFGLYEDSLLCKRLDALLSFTAMKYATSPDFMTTCESFQQGCSNGGIYLLLSQVALREHVKKYCLTTLHDPVCRDPRDWKLLTSSMQEFWTLREPMGSTNGTSLFSSLT